VVTLFVVCAGAVLKPVIIAGMTLKVDQGHRQWNKATRHFMSASVATTCPIKFCSVLYDVPVEACWHKQDSLIHRDGLRDKQTPPLTAINYSTVEIVDDTPPVIDLKA